MPITVRLAFIIVAASALGLSETPPTTTPTTIESRAAAPVLVRERVNAAVLLERLPLAFEASDRDGFTVRARGALTRVTRTGVSVAAAGSAGTVGVTFVGAVPGAPPRPAKRLAGYSNYLLGTDRTAWRTHVARYERVRARHVYPGIDVEYYGTQQQLEYDFIVSPGVDPSAIRLAVTGARDATITPSGDLGVEGGQRLLQRRPVAYQVLDGARRPIDAGYVAHDNGTFGVRVGPYDARYPLVIDPVLVYSFGGGGTGRVTDLAVDASGAAYVVGDTTSAALPVVDPYQAASAGARDGFVIKLNPAGTDIEYATYLGGANYEYLEKIGLDAGRNIYVAGTTYSGDFPGGAVGACPGTCEIFVKLSSDGATLIYTYFKQRNGWDVTLLDFDVSDSGLPFFLLQHQTFDAKSVGLYSLSQSGTTVTGITGLNTLLNPLPIGMAVGPNGDVYLSSANVTIGVPVTRTIERWRPDGVRGSSVTLQTNDVGSVGVSTDGSIFFARTGTNSVRVIRPDGVVQAPVMTLPMGANWSSVRGPYFGRDAANGMTATLCGSGGFTSTVQEDCTTSRLSVDGVILGSDTIDPDWTFATGADGMLYAASTAGANIAVRKYSFLTVDSFEADGAAASPYGTPITWTATMTPANGFEYSFWRSDGGNWIQAQPYSSANTYTWTPGAAAIGPHELQVWVRRAGSPHALEAWEGAHVDITPAAPPVVDGLAISSDPAPAGSPVTFSAATHGGVAPLEYQYWRRDADGWHLGRDYSSSADYAWTPGVGDVGTHAIQVWVRNAGSPAAYESYTGREFTVAGPAPLRLTRLIGPTGSIPAGTAATWTAEAHGGIGPLQYRFWRLDGSTWTLAQDYGPSASYTWTPAVGDQEPHALQVWVRSAGSVAAYDDWGGLSFQVGAAAPATITALTANTAVRTPGVPITWTASAGGGVAPLLYQYWRLDADGWHMVRDYAADPTYTWTPGAGDVGPHALQVWVRSTGSSAAYEAWMGTAIFQIQ